MVRVCVSKFFHEIHFISDIDPEILEKEKNSRTESGTGDFFVNCVCKKIKPHNAPIYVPIHFKIFFFLIKNIVRMLVQSLNRYPAPIFLFISLRFFEDM